MGCTSSTPNMPPSLTNSAKDINLLEVSNGIEKAIEEGQEVILEKGNEMKELNVLPLCDTLGESTQLDRNMSSKTLVDMGTESEKDSHANGHVMEIQTENTTTDTDDLSRDTDESRQTEEKLSKLEEVVEKVVELYVEHGLEKTQPEQSSKEDKQNDTEEHKEDIVPESNEDVVEEKETKENPEDAVSPSQSQSSHATRWEALADIAAELPPSLAVDPLTGQIYALTK